MLTKYFLKQAKGILYKPRFFREEIDKNTNLPTFIYLNNYWQMRDDGTLNSNDSFKIY